MDTFTADDAITVTTTMGAVVTGAFLFAGTDDPGDRRQFMKFGSDFVKAYPSGFVVFEVEGARRWARFNQIVLG